LQVFVHHVSNALDLAGDYVKRRNGNEKGELQATFDVAFVMERFVHGGEEIENAEAKDQASAEATTGEH
jgi:hypothetical protein